MEKDIYLPTLSHWEYGNIWSGEHGRSRFYITPKDGQMTAEMWLGPMCREYSKIELTEVFPVSEEGLKAMHDWLLEQADLLNARAEEQS